jgi:hypothetical protein
MKTLNMKKRMINRMMGRKRRRKRSVTRRREATRAGYRRPLYLLMLRLMLSSRT